MIKLFIAKGPDEGRSFSIKADTAQIGRGSGNEVRLNESSVSRKHLRIYRDNGHYYVEDLHSKNGTWIDGDAIQSGVKVQVQEGVPIAIGKVLLSIGKKCSPDRTPNRYSIDVEVLGEDQFKPANIKDRRGKQRKELELIYEISLDLLASLDVSELSSKVLESIFRCLKRIDSGFVFLVQPESGRLKKVAGRARESSGKEVPGYSKSLVRRVVKEGKAIMLRNAATAGKPDMSDSMEKIGIKSVICVPLVSRMGTRGALYLQSMKVADGFRKNDLIFLTGLSNPMALAIENALLYAKSKQAEEELQKASADLEKKVIDRTAELKKAKDELEHLSITDPLSGLYNYRYLNEALEAELKRASRYHHTLALLLIDIDYFKNFNDTYGHLCGDFVIRSVAKILKSNVRATDVVARYGGDELAVILIETGAESAHEVAEKLKREIGGHAFQWQTRQMSVNVSIGVATAPAPKIQGVSELIEAADRALYQAKETGRNTVVVFDQSGARSGFENEGEAREHS